MRTFFVAAISAAALSAPAFAQVTAEELFAMSNDSAAETIVREGSMGDTTAAAVKLALGNMSAAERMAFFMADSVERQKVLKKIKLFGDSNSAAEMAAEAEKFMNSN